MDARDVTFEEGYRRLQGIAERLNSDEVPVHEMCDLFAEGTGLHQALGQYLREQRARVEAIERGEGVHAFRIVPPRSDGPERTEEAPAGATGPRAPAGADGPAGPLAAADGPPWARAPAGGAGTPPADDEIPF